VDPTVRELNTRAGKMGSVSPIDIKTNVWVRNGAGARI